MPVCSLTLGIYVEFLWGINQKYQPTSFTGTILNLMDFALLMYTSYYINELSQKCVNIIYLEQSQDIYQTFYRTIRLID